MLHYFEQHWWLAIGVGTPILIILGLVLNKYGKPILSTYLLRRKILELSTYKDLYKSNYKLKPFNISLAATETVKRFETGLRELIESNGTNSGLLRVACLDYIVLQNLPLREIIDSKQYLESNLNLEILKEFLNEMTIPDATEVVGVFHFISSFRG